MQAEDRVRIEHVLDAVEAALTFVEGHERADLETDVMLRFTVVRVPSRSSARPLQASAPKALRKRAPCPECCPTGR